MIYPDPSPVPQSPDTLAEAEARLRKPVRKTKVKT